MKESTIRSCRNCKTEFSGNFCPQCGQSTKDYERPLLSLVSDLITDVFSFDTRFWKTILATFFMPAQLITNYVEGKNVRYMPPFRLYLFVSFIFFILLNSVTNQFFQTNGTIGGQLDKAASVLDSIQQNAAADSLIKEINQNIGEEVLLNSDSLAPIILDSNRNSDGIHLSIGNTQKDISSEELVARFNTIADNPSAYFEKFSNYISWTLFFLMPILGLIFWLFFRRNKKFYISHFLFALNQHTLLFFLASLVMALHLIWPNSTNQSIWSLFLLLPIMTYIGAVQLFGYGWIRTIFKLLITGFLYSILVLIASGTILIIAFFT
jgi:hypothetical protein